MRGKDGTRVQLPAGFLPQGWLGEDFVVGNQWTLVGGQVELPRTVAIVDASSGQERNLGLAGDFLGALSPG